MKYFLLCVTDDHELVPAECSLLEQSCEKESQHGRRYLFHNDVTSIPCFAATRSRSQQSPNTASL